jgi:hypothetical protein
MNRNASPWSLLPNDALRFDDVELMNKAYFLLKQEIMSSKTLDHATIIESMDYLFVNHFGLDIDTNYQYVSKLSQENLIEIVDKINVYEQIVPFPEKFRTHVPQPIPTKHEFKSHSHNRFSLFLPNSRGQCSDEIHYSYGSTYFYLILRHFYWLYLKISLVFLIEC